MTNSSELISEDPQRIKTSGKKVTINLALKPTTITGEIDGKTWKMVHVDSQHLGFAQVDLTHLHFIRVAMKGPQLTLTLTDKPTE